jgi:hypothetical protein
MSNNEYLRLNDTKMNIEKAANLIAIIEDKRKDAVQKKEVQSESSLFSELFKAFKDFFANLGKPTIQKRFLKKESPARSSDFNNTMQEIHNDIHVAYTETDSLSSVIVKDFNYSETDRQMLLNKVRKLSSQATDYSFYSEGAKSRSLFAIDDFIDNSKIDFSKVSPGVPAAELVTNEGVVTLKRIGNIDRAPLVEKVTGVKESLPSWDATGEFGGYEGLYFGVKNEPRPEGGRFHVTYSQDGTRFFEQGASEEEKMVRRLSMFDGNPDTFWEVENLTSPIIGYKDKYSGKQLTVSEFNELIANEVNSPSVQTGSGGTIITNDHGSLIENYIPVTNSSSSLYFNCSFIVHLSRAENLNWISLNPNNFGQDLYMEVLSIQTSSDGQKFNELEGFDDYEYETMLTKQANSELNPKEVQDTLSPDQFKYAGQGVWVFSPRLVRAIKFDIRQTRSYLKQYEVLMVEIEQTVTTTTTTSKFWGLSKKTSTESYTTQRQVEIPYLTGQIAGFDVMSLEPGDTVLSGSTPFDIVGGVVGAGVGAVGGAIAGLQIGASLGPIGAGIGAVLGFVIGGLFGSSKKTETSVSPQRMTKQWTKIKNDKARFAIGVRDINLYSYRFSEVSEVVSKPFLSPSPIGKVSLSVEEQVPGVFYKGSGSEGTENNWIKYYISVDNGTSWKRISPIHHRATISEDGVNLVPEIINFNSEVVGAERKNPLAYVDTGSPIYEIRFKAVLTRPTTISDAESYTPVLKKYALQIYPLGGL